MIRKLVTPIVLMMILTVSSSMIFGQQIHVTPDSIMASVGTADSTMRMLKINNTGTDSLRWSIQVKKPQLRQPTGNYFGGGFELHQANSFSGNIQRDSRSTSSSGFYQTPMSVNTFTAAKAATGPVTTIVLTTTGTEFSIDRALNELGIPFDKNSSGVFSSVDLNPYDNIIVGMDGGSVMEADVQALATAAASGKKLIMIGGTNYANYYNGMSLNLLSHTGATGWTTVYGTPHMTVTNSSHPLAANLPATYNFSDISATYYMLRISDPNATTVALSGDGYPMLVEKPIGSGSLVYFTGSASGGYWSFQNDFDILKTVIKNAMSGAPWIRPSLTSGTIAPGDSANISLILDADKLVAGDYAMEIHILNNDTLDTLVIVPISLNVLNVNAILSVNSLQTTLSSLDSVLLPLTFNPTGSGTLKWSGSIIGQGGPMVQLTAASGSVPAGSSTTFNVKIIDIAPDSGTFNYSIHFTTNDTAHPSIDVPLAVTVIPAELEALPDSINAVNVGVGDSVTQNLSIKNTGAGTLAWSIDLRTGPPPAYQGGGDLAFRNQENLLQSDRSHASGDTHLMNYAARTTAKGGALRSALPYRPKVLILTDCDDPTYPQNELVSTGLFDYEDFALMSTYSTPSINDLMPYDAILFYTDCGFSYPTEVGDVLKQYVDNGGGLVMATFAYSNTWSIAGGILDPGYSPFLPGTEQAVYGSIDMSTLPFSNHPIFKDIINDPYYSSNTNYSNPSLNTGGILLAQDYSGNNVVAVNTTGRIVGMAIWPQELYYANDETRLLFANALNFVSRPPWLRFNPAAGLTSAGATSNVSVVIDAAELLPGPHNHVFAIHSNDPLDSLHIVPVHINVLAATASLSAGSVNLTASASDSLSVLSVSNTGAGTLRFNANMQFGFAMGVSPATGAVKGSAQNLFLKIFNTTLPGVYQDTIIMSTNDTGNLFIKIPVNLTVLAPQISIVPDSFSVKIEMQDSTSGVLTLQNNGSGKLVWNLAVQDVSDISRTQKRTDGQRAMSTTTSNSNHHQPNRIKPSSSGQKASLFEKILQSQMTAAIPGDFTLKASSSVPLTCITVNPKTNIIYGQENRGNRFFQYDPKTDEWTELEPCPIYSGNNGGATYWNGKIITSYNRVPNLGIYDIVSNTWTTDTSYVETGNIESVGGLVYLINEYSFQRYNPATMHWDSLAMPGGQFDEDFDNRWGGLKYFNGYLYNFEGDGWPDSAFAKYNIASNTWTVLPGLPGGAVLGSAIDPVTHKLFAYGDYGEANWYAFDLITETWSVTELPFFQYDGETSYGLDDGGMVYVSSGPTVGIYFTEGEDGTGFAVFETPRGLTWVSPEISSGIVAGGASQSVNLKIKADTLGIGDYRALITVSSNDTGNSSITIPVSMKIRQDAKGPHTQIHFFQDNYLTQYLDVVASASEALGFAPTIEVTKPDNSTEDLTIDTVDLANNVFYSHFKLDQDGTFSFKTIATDTAGNAADTTRSLSAALGKANAMLKLTSSDASATLSIEENSLKKDAVITVAQAYVPVVLSEEARSVSDRYTFGPEGIELVSAVTVTFDYSKIRSVDEEHLVIYRKTKDGLAPLKSTINRSARTVSANADKLGEFQLFHNTAIRSGEETLVPKQFSLYQNYPNPFNPSTSIKFDMPVNGRVNIAVYNILGQKVRTLADRHYEAGSYTVVWDGKNERGRIAASGIYIYQIKTDKFTQARKMLFLK